MGQLSRCDAAVITFDTFMTDTTTPERWIEVIRESREDIPIVACGVIGLSGKQQSTTDEEFQAVCASAGVEYFKVDLDANNGQLEEMIETVIDKATARNTNS